MIYYLYKITNTLNGRYYIGMHSTNNVNDGYFGSGKLLGKAIKKYDKQNFLKEILCFVNNKEELRELEELIVTADWILENRDIVYNVQKGGLGGAAIGNKNRLGKPHSEKVKLKMSQDRKGSKHPMFGKKQSLESRKKMSLNKKGILRWFNNGVNQIMIDPNGNIPVGYTLGRGWRQK